MEGLQLLFTPKGEDEPVGGSANMVESKISISGGNASKWSGMIHQTPAGGWELTLPYCPDVRHWFADEEIQDIVLTITYGGHARVAEVATGI